MYQPIKYALFFCFLLGAAAPTGALFAQSDAAEQRYAPKRFEEQTWQKATEGLEYVLPPRKNSKKKRKGERGEGRLQNKDTEAMGANASAAFKLISIILLAGLVAFLIYQLTRAPRNKKIRDQELYRLAHDLEGDLPSESLDTYIRQAEQSGQYGLAIRFYFLKTLQALQEKQCIRWKKDKTNREYVQELRGTPLLEGFQQGTAIFDRVRYGEYLPGEQHYRELSQVFIRLIAEAYAPTTAKTSPLNPVRHE